MEMLSLFDAEVAATDGGVPEEDVALAQDLPKTVLITRELDLELLEDIESGCIGPKTLAKEAEFLAGYFERHGFARDKVRLDTIKYHFSQNGQA